MRGVLALRQRVDRPAGLGAAHRHAGRARGVHAGRVHAAARSRVRGDHDASFLALLLYGLVFGTSMKRHHAVVRITHWVNVVALTIMVGSGLRIFNAYPAFARRGEIVLLLSVRAPTDSRRAHVRRLARRRAELALRDDVGARASTASSISAFIYLHGEWRDLVPRRGIVRDAWEMVRFYLTVRKDHPRQGKHNALQRLAYFSMPIVGIDGGRHRASRSGSRCSSRRSRTCSAATCGRATGISGRCCCSSR